MTEPGRPLREDPWKALRSAQKAYDSGWLDDARFYAEAARDGFAHKQEQEGLTIALTLLCSLAIISGDSEAASGYLEAGFAALPPGMDLLRAKLLEQRWLLSRAEKPSEFDQQEQILLEALHLYQSAAAPQPEHEARILDHLGVLAMERGHLSRAIELLERSVNLLGTVGSPPWEVGFNLAAALSADCRFEDALALFLPISRQSERPMRRLIGALNLLDIYITLDDAARAEEVARQALELAGGLKTPHLAARVRVELARLYRLQGEYDLAVAEARTALAQATKGADRSVEQDARRALAETLLWTQVGAGGAPEPGGLPPGSPEATRIAAVASIYMLRSRVRATREEGAALLRQTLRDLSQHGSFRSFVLRHRDLALTLAVVGLSAGVLPSACQSILALLAEAPEQVRGQGIRLPAPESRYLAKAADALDEQDAALLERLIHPEQRDQLRPAKAPLLSVRLLGRFGIRLNGEPLEARALGWRRAKALLITLLLIPEGVERSLLADWLWPGASSSTGLKYLRVSLHHLRHLLEPGRPQEEPSAFVADKGGKLIWVAERTRVDMWEVEERLRTALRALRQNDPATAAQAYERAVALYRGDLVIDDCPWLEAVSTHLHQQILEACFWLAERHCKGHPDDAIAYLRRLLHLEQGDERAVRQLMLLLAAAGRQAEVAQVYRQCCDYLEHEVGVSVSLPTTTAYEEAIGLRNSPGGPH